MTDHQWMIYGAYGYSAQLIIELAVNKGLRPIVAGRNQEKTQAIAEKFNLESRAFDLTNHTVIKENLTGVSTVIHCAGPFSATSAPMIEGCLLAKTNYFDITGEISVFEHAHSKEINDRAIAADITICPGIGFDVIPTDCIAKTLSEAMPDATHLEMAFASKASLSPGTAKTSIEGLAKGTLERINGRIQSVKAKVKTVPMSTGPQKVLQMSWGDVSTAYYTTGIPNIALYIGLPEKQINAAGKAAWFRWLFKMTFVQNYLKKKVEASVKGPDKTARDASSTHLWGKASNAKGQTIEAHLTTANGYTLTQIAPVMIIEHLCGASLAKGSQTPALLFGKNFVSTLDGCSEITLTSKDT
ncbi:saccharopine dehydrogenase NADP-binding domain-containing protein [Temperatibacter marinus]|uniref:Saccharopine dehydrogenase NADP-binding domain-containing protein n=1 Tax=Temperatibacter marinus TaxID=1456591 RepID=A0AA52EFV2_9PROT|nr:saccharopine dehydrogenase NADP-binding domain-containing protein [Temperatibacter marinus]WND01759.1 saccharopine dehydrogenase NADP-binding domain-containing protein [Temperatibacter marinus]